MIQENLFYIAITSISEFMNQIPENTQIYYLIGQQEIGHFHGITREMWTLRFSYINNGTCIYFLQVIGFTESIGGKPFNEEVYNEVICRSDNLREQIIEKGKNSEFDFVPGGISFPKDIRIIEANDLKFEKEKNRIVFDW